MALSKAELAFVIGIDVVVVDGSSVVLVDIAGREACGGRAIQILF